MLSKIALTIVVIGICIWWFLKENTRRGHLTIRGYIFLTALESGKTKDEANHASSAPFDQIPPVIIHSTMDYLDKNYGGKQMKLIAAARKKGMKH
ncbi:hypothetical protein WNY59_09075 [Ahrensia kielensis]|uniref:Uncharacterized protein n=1 Tax=Ahrensia kielensis TaxID=76980 RepID=A0ABU9T7R0_9HYPH